MAEQKNGHVFNILNTIQKNHMGGQTYFQRRNIDIVIHYHSLKIIKIL